MVFESQRFCSITLNALLVLKFVVRQRQCVVEINNSVLSKVTFRLEDDDRNTIDFNSEKITFTLFLIKTQRKKVVIESSKLIRFVLAAAIIRQLFLSKMT